MLVRRRPVLTALALLCALMLPSAPVNAAGVTLSLVVPSSPPALGSLCATHSSITLTVQNTGYLASPVLPNPYGIAISGNATGTAALPSIPAQGGSVQVTIPLTLQPPSPPNPDPNAGKPYAVSMNLIATLDLQHRTTPTSPIKAVIASATHCPSGSPPTPAPGSGPSRGRLNQQVQKPDLVLVPAPSKVHATTDVAECQQHNGNFFCAALKGGAPNFMLLVWNGYTTADAYHVYRTDGGKRVSVASGSQPFNGSIPTAQGLESVAPGSCFSVSETRAGTESDLSAPFCVGSVVPAKEQVVTLKPIYIRTSRSYKGHTPQPDLSAHDSTGVENEAGKVVVGYVHATNNMGALGDEWSNNYYRAGLYFNVGFLAGKHLTYATLNLRTAQMYHSEVHNANQYTSASGNCVATVASGAGSWWTSNARVEYGQPVEVVQGTANRLHFDISDVARAWASGAPNLGLVLIGSDENLYAFTETACMSTFYSSGPDMPTLTISYH